MPKRLLDGYFHQSNALASLMLTSLTLTNFRGFSHLEFPKLARVNLIGGVNNAGKTSILEAIFLLLELHPDKIRRLPNLFRAPSDIDDDRYFWDWITHSGKSDGEASIAADLRDIGFMEARWSLHQPLDALVAPTVFEQFANRYTSEDPLIVNLIQNLSATEVFSPGPTTPVEDAQIYIRAVKQTADNEERIETLLREIEPRLKRVRSYSDEKTNQPILHAGLNTGEVLPASQLGQGFNRLLRIYSALLCADAKVFLIDEVETGLHHDVLPLIWKGLAAVARQEDVQIFATTHSREAILAAHRVFSKEPTYDFAYHRLERVNGEVQVVTYDQEALSGADEANFEIR